MVEINEDHQMRTNRGYLFRACYYKGIGHHHLGLAETQRQFYSLKREREVLCTQLKVVGKGKLDEVNDSAEFYMVR